MVSKGRGLFSRSRHRAAALICALTAGVLAGCEQEPVAEEVSVRPVRYAQVQAQRGLQTRTFSGVARAERETDMSFRVAGTVILRPVNIGDFVANGQLVAALDDTDYQVRVDEARAGIARAEAELRNAQARYERTRALYENQTASRSDLDAARAAAESAQAQLRAASQQLEAARLQLSYTRLVAPEQCAVAQTFVEINQNVSSGQPVLRLNCGECGEVVVSIPETEISRVVEGSSVDVRFDALPDEIVAGVVQEVAVATGPASTTYPVTVGLQERCDAVRSGMAADVAFAFRSAGPEGSLVVPYVSVGEDDAGNFVFVLERDADDRLFARRRTVEVGAPTPEGLLIENGLTEGELIATAGVRRLKDDQQVRLLGEPESAAP